MHLNHAAIENWSPPRNGVEWISERLPGTEDVLAEMRKSGEERLSMS
jgi:hypothetical protein